MKVHPGAAGPAAFYKLLTSAVVPRPIAWVSTVDADGRPNLAPFSFFTVASVDPPVLAFATLRERSGGRVVDKDTLKNVEATGACIVHVVPFALAEAMNATAARLPSGTSEAERAGLDLVPGEAVPVPRVAAAPVAFEARLDRIERWGQSERAGRLVLVHVVLAHLDEAVSNGRYALLDALDPIGRLGGSDYVRARNGAFTLERPA